MPLIVTAIAIVVVVTLVAVLGLLKYPELLINQLTPNI